jgi:hypothetical protein
VTLIERTTSRDFSWLIDSSYHPHASLSLTGEEASAWKFVPECWISYFSRLV